jgi:hypothetical protein
MAFASLLYVSQCKSASFLPVDLNEQLAACVIGLVPAALLRVFEAPELFLILVQFSAAAMAFGFLAKRLRTRKFLQCRI